MGLTFDDVEPLPSFVNKYKVSLTAQTVSRNPPLGQTGSIPEPDESNLSPNARQLSAENRSFLESLGLKLAKDHVANRRESPVQ